MHRGDQMPLLNEQDDSEAVDDRVQDPKLATHDWGEINVNISSPSDPSATSATDPKKDDDQKPQESPSSFGLEEEEEEEEREEEPEETGRNNSHHAIVPRPSEGEGGRDAVGNGSAVGGRATDAGISIGDVEDCHATSRKRSVGAGAVSDELLEKRQR